MAASRRLNKELKDFQTNQPDWCSAEIVDNNMYLWKATLHGPKGTPYENGFFKIDIKIPNEFPFKPPVLQFASKIYHPNIKSDGTVCTDILGAWSPQLTIQEVLLSIKSILMEPNPDNSLEPEIGRQFKENKKAFVKTAKEWTKKYAKK